MDEAKFGDPSLQDEVINSSIGAFISRIKEVLDIDIEEYIHSRRSEEEKYKEPEIEREKLMEIASPVHKIAIIMARTLIEYQEVSKLIKENGCYEDYDDNWYINSVTLEKNPWQDVYQPDKYTWSGPMGMALELMTMNLQEINDLKNLLKVECDPFETKESKSSGFSYTSEETHSVYRTSIPIIQLDYSHKVDAISPEFTKEEEYPNIKAGEMMDGECYKFKILSKHKKYFPTDTEMNTIL